ncbi:MAG: chromosome segregation protein SMC [Bacillota bacterium]|nr:chromosome segregation protein SMC [Bacillota bacterium]
MYLKRVEMQGFKSFTTKTIVDFEPGISCIVGPNGSGKSNIADALRWVLGEQSARNLRGGKLEDVIFSGSKKRRPLGMAEVTVVLDNSDGYLPLDFTEISVTRRAQRNGAGEFLINDQPCRLKDIRDLFVDTGIGVHGLSLIDQGRIAELIAARPEERRALVEEAAGIIKYRDRKREAVRKLGETENHLLRIGDIVNELSARIEPLSAAAHKAQTFLTLQAEADQTEIGISVRVLSEAGDRIAALDTSIAELEQRLLDIESERLLAAASASELQQQIAAIDEQVTGASQDYYRLQAEREKAEGERNLAQAEEQNLRATIERLTRELQAVEQSIESERQAAQSAAQQGEQLTAEIAALTERIISGEGGHSERVEAATLLDEQLNSCREQAFAAASAVAETANQLGFKQTLIDKGQAAVQRIEDELAALNEEGAQSERRARQLQDETAQAKQRSAELSSRFNEQQQQMLRLNQAVQDAAAVEAELRFEQHSQQTRINMIEEMTASYEGFFPGVRGLMAAKAKGEAPAGVIDAVAGLLRVPEQYTAAVEAYLGANIQNIVCESAEAAKKAVDFLKRRQLGRATFLPLDILKVRAAHDFSAVAGLNGVYGRASELVSCDEHIRPACDFLLNNVLIVDNMDTALAAAKALKYQCSVVTIDGDMVNPGASIAGGSRSAKGGELLSKRNQLAAAKAALQELGQRLRAAEGELTAARGALAEHTAAAEQLREQLSQVSAALAGHSAAGQRLAAEDEARSRRIEALRAERRQAADELELLNEQVNELQQQQQHYQQQQNRLTEQLQAIEQQREQAQSLADSVREDMTQQRVELAALQEKAQGLKEAGQKTAAAIDTLGWEAESKAADLAEAERQAADKAAAIEQRETALLELARSLMEAEEALNSRRHGLIAETDRLQALQKQEKDSYAAAEKAAGELHQLQLRRTRWQADWENEEAKLRDKYQLSFEQARLTAGDVGSRSGLAQRLNQLRREIAALGNINIDAIEEYRDVQERYTFLTAQTEDLLKAKQQLESVITEMDGVMLSRFRDMFYQLSDAFNGSFTRLFGGGEAALFLSDPDDLLETGVELSVNLPGKKVANYNLLSGGEKALIGIALMFAMLTVRPTPFCIMDEVDAALDEANIDRFTAYLSDKSTYSQFVMISHRQSTMEAAQTLWGVTMEEEGVSKVISVRLSELDH